MRKEDERKFDAPVRGQSLADAGQNDSSRRYEKRTRFAQRSSCRLDFWNSLAASAKRRPRRN
jgi:hypothetical protein